MTNTKDEKIFDDLLDEITYKPLSEEEKLIKLNEYATRVKVSNPQLFSNLAGWLEEIGYSINKNWLIK